MSSSPALTLDALRAASPPPATIKLESGLMLPAQPTTQPRGRRKRMAIEIPAELELANMDPKDVKKIKNRIAAARLRERSQQQIRELQAMVQFYKARTEYLESVVAGCAHCSCLAQIQQVPPQSSDLLARPSLPAASPQRQHRFSGDIGAMPHHIADAGSQCNSPASSTEDEYMGNCDLTLDDLDCDLLAKMLLMSE